LVDALPFRDALVGIAQVSIVFAGFAGISVVLSRRLPEQWTYGEAVRMACMIESSLSAAFFALLPFAFVGFGAKESTTWSASGFLFAIVMFAHMVATAVRMRRAYRQDPSDRLPLLFRIPMLIIGVAVLSALILNSLDIVFHQSFGPYFAALLFHLAFSSLMFMRSLTLIRDTAREKGG
jgi:hypothetical protein